jgi:predicted permease
MMGNMGQLWDGLWHDIRYGARSLLRRPVLSGAVAITLLVGIGLNTAVFTVVDGMWFRPRIEKDPGSFVQMLAGYPDGPPGKPGEPWTTSLAGYEAFRQRSHTVTDLAAWRVIQSRVDDEVQLELPLLVTCNFFSLYGLDHVSQGRLFRADECTQSGAARVVVISEEMWRSRFLSTPAILGARIRLNERPYTIVGVVPMGFSGRLRGGGIWVPYTMQADFFAGRNLFAEPETPWLYVEGRLRPGATRVTAEAELNAIAATLAGKPRMILTNGSFGQHPALRTMMLGIVPLLGATMTLLLLLTCSNVTMLLLARAAARRQEIAVRRALGADRTRLLRMLLTEGLLLASVAGSAAAGLAYGIPAAFRALFWRAPHYPVKPDGVVFAYLAGITLLAGCLAGLGPALESFRADLSPLLKKQPVFAFRRLLGKRRGRWQLRDLQVAALVALSVVLVTGAALFARAQYAMYAASLRADMAQSLMVALRGRPPAEARGVFDRALVERVRTIPGVISAEVSVVSPMARQLGVGNTRQGRFLSVRVEGNASDAAIRLAALLQQIDSEQVALPSTVQSAIQEMGSRFRMLSSMVIALGGIALLLAVVGVYGVVAFAVSQRRQELAIRVALGARRADIMQAVLRPGMRPILAGIAVGLLFSVGGGAALVVAFRGSPVALNGWDPLAYTAVCAVLGSASLAAMVRPAWRAAGADPAAALREE